MIRAEGLFRWARSSWARECGKVGLLLLALAIFFYQKPLFHREVLGSFYNMLENDPWRTVTLPPTVHPNLPAHDHWDILFPWMAFAQRTLSQGILPLWDPYPAGGTPFLAKQEPALFSPFHIPYYLFPSLDFFVLFALFKVVLAGLLAYAYARRWMDPWSSALTAVAYGFCGFMMLYMPYPHSAIFALMPLLFILTDLYLDRGEWKVLPLLSLAVGWSLVLGHGETSIHCFLGVGLYFLARLYGLETLTLGEKIRRVELFVLWAVLGALPSLVHLGPSWEYFQKSYAKIWRGEFHWTIVNNISRPLSRGDVLPLVLGLAAGGGVFWGYRKFFHSLKKGTGASLIFLPVLSFLLAFFLATFANSGMELYFLTLPDWVARQHFLTVNVHHAGIISLLLSLWAFGNKKTPFPALWVTVILTLLISMKMPILCHVLNQVPVYNSSSNYRSLIVMAFCIAVLAGRGLQCFRERHSQESQPRWFYAAHLFSLVFLVWSAAWLTGFLRDPLVRILGTGVSPESRLDPRDPERGGIYDAGYVWILKDSTPVRGWVSGPVSAVAVGMLNEDGTPANQQMAQVTYKGDHVVFEGVVPLPFGDKYPYAVVLTPDGAKHFMRGTKVRRMTLVPAHFYEVVALLCLGALLLLSWGRLGFWGNLVPIFGLLLVDLFHFHHLVTDATPRELLYPKTPVIELLLSDPTLFRFHSFQEAVFHAESSTAYGLQDFRNYDTLDVLRFIQFSRFLHFLWSGSEASQHDLAYDLMDLAGVKYYLGPPIRPSSRLEKVYSQEMEVHRSRSVLPRVGFYSQALFFPDKGIRSSKDFGSFFSGFKDFLGSHRVDPRKVLVIHEPEEPLGPSSGQPAKVELVHYVPDRVDIQVDSDRPGYVFLGDVNFPGWRVSVDDKPAKLVSSWICFRSVYVPAGKHRVRFFYHSRSFIGGLWVTLISTGLFLLSSPFLRPPSNSPPEVVAHPTLPKGKGKLGKREVELPIFQEGYQLTHGVLVGLTWTSWVYWGSWTLFWYQGGIFRSFQTMQWEHIFAQGLGGVMLGWALLSAKWGKKFL
ncbi:MAG: hypothetical protein HY399_06460 [Elusimicrobia bacterium]|nr:hypothetical protein [Elusimicrobiota bacterium]